MVFWREGAELVVLGGFPPKESSSTGSTAAALPAELLLLQVFKAGIDTVLHIQALKLEKKKNHNLK